MRIAVDARFVGTPGGIGRYTEELVRAMTMEAPENEYVLFLREPGLARFAGLSRVKAMPAEVPWYGWQEQLQMPGIARSAKADLVHWTHWNVPLQTPRPFVLTIHDLIQFDYPSVRSTTLGPIKHALKFSAFRIVIEQAIKKSAAILVPTMYVKSRVVDLFRIDGDKVRVSGEGLTELPRLTPEQGREIRQKRNIPEKYILALGNAYPHKNLEGLVSAFAELCKQHTDTSLVIAGHDDYFFQRLKRETKEKRQDSGVIFIPSPDDRVAAALYQGAAVFSQLSFTEGFGLPPLEAMRAGVPVVSSDRGSLPEVLGSAAQFVNPASQQEIIEALRRVLAEADLRNRLIGQGREQIKKWTWRNTARKTLDVYSKVLNK